ncbi:MAG: hypothetical protein V7742_10970 [Halioglobus sp.]
MQTSIATQELRQAPTAGLQLVSREDSESKGNSIDPMTLAYLNFGLFKSLCKLGVSRERICSALTISYDEFDYICKLSTT